jgi:hypothetical protein
MLRRLQIKFGLWLLRRSFPRQSEKQRSVWSNIVMDGLDPCQLFVDAAAQSVTEINQIMDDLQAAMELSFMRTQALYQCRLDNPGSGSEGSGGGGPVGP